MPTVNHAVAAYLADLQERQCRSVHIRSVRSRLSHFSRKFGDRTVGTLTRADIAQHLNNLENERTQGTMAGISATHRAFWTWCHKQNWTDVNLGANLRRYDYTPSVRTAARPDHVEALVAAIPRYIDRRRGMHYHAHDIRAGLLVSLSLDSGARLGEMANIRVADVLQSLERPHWTQEGPAYVVGSQGKTGSAKIVFFDQTAQLFTRWFEHLPQGAAFVFCNLETGRKMDRNSLSRLFPRVCKFAGVPSFRSHAIRKRNICDIVDEDGFAAAQDYAGHSNIQTTRRHYYQANHERTVLAAAKMNQRRRESALEADQMANLFGLKSRSKAD